jgi:hypothetical protein
MSQSHRRATSRKEIKRLDHKKARAAERQVLSGGHHRSPRALSWSDKLPQPPILDAPSNGKVRSKKNCPKNKGGAHYPVHAKRRQQGYRDGEPFYGWSYRSSKVVCLHCNKDMWRYRGPVNPHPTPARIIDRREEAWMVSTVDHYDRFNIRMRLLGLSCRCLACNSD